MFDDVSNLFMTAYRDTQQCISFPCPLLHPTYVFCLFPIILAVRPETTVKITRDCLKGEERRNSYLL